MSLKKIEDPDSLLSTIAELEALESRFRDSAQDNPRQKKLYTLASTLCQCVKSAEREKEKRGDIGIDVLIRINYSVNEYKALMTELQQRSWCCCFPKKHGAREDRMCVVVRIRLTEAFFIVKSSVIDARCTKLFQDVKEANEFADVLSDMSGRTAILDMKDNYESKSAVQTMLLQLLHRIEKFNHIFVSGGGNGSPDQNPRRFVTLQRNLSTPPGSMTAMQDYSQANRMLYDMAALGSRLLSFNVGECLAEVAVLVTSLKEAREEELRGFSSALEDDDADEGDEGSGRGVVGTRISSDDEEVHGIAEYSVHYDQRVNNRLIALSAMWSELKERLACSGFLAPYFGNASGEGHDEVILDAISTKPSAGHSASAGLGRSGSKVYSANSSYNRFRVSSEDEDEGFDGFAFKPTVASTRPSDYAMNSAPSSVDGSGRGAAGPETHNYREDIAESTHSSSSSQSSSRRAVPESVGVVGVAAPPRNLPSGSSRRGGRDGSGQDGSSRSSGSGRGGRQPMPTHPAVPRSSISYPQEEGGGGGMFGISSGSNMKAKLLGSMSSAASKAAEKTTKAASIASQKTRKAASLAAETTSSKVARAKERLMGNNYSAVIDFDSERSFY